MMQPATQLQFTNQLSPSGQCIPPPQPIYCLQDKVGKPFPQQHEARKSKEQLLHQAAQSKTEPRRIPRLRAVVESQAFKNILVDEMDMMLSRAATLIQANWRGYRLRQKLISQMMAAKAIQEAWRRFNTRRLLRSSKAMVKRVSKEEGDIPYHPPQQVRFQPPEEKHLPVQPVMMSKETQFPSSDSLATCAPQLTLLKHPAGQGVHEPGMQAPHAPGAHGVAFLPHQTIAIRLPSPASLDSKCQPCLLTKTVRSTCLVRHIEGDTVKTKSVPARAAKAAAPEPPPSGRYGQAVSGSFKTQTQAHMEAEIHKTPPQAFPASTLTKTPPKTYPVVSITRTQAQVSPMSTMTKTLAQTCPGPMMTVMKTLPQPCPSPTVTKTPAQMRPTPSLTNAPLQTRIAATMAKIPPQVCLLASVIRPPPQARPAATTARPPPQTCPVSAMTKTAPQMRLVTTPTKNQMQTCQAATVPKTPSQICPGVSMMKPPPQTRLAAMITKTPAQIRSVAAVLRTLCLVPPAVGNLRAPPTTAGAAGTPNTASTTHLNAPKAKVTMNVKQTAGVVRGSSHSYLAEGKIRSVPPSHLEAGAPRPMAKGPLEPEKIKTGLQKHVKRETGSKTNMAMGTARPSSWTKVAEDRSRPPPPQAQRIEIIKVQSQVYVPVETVATLPRAQLAVPLTKTVCPPHPATRQTKALAQEQLAAPLTKALSQVHPAMEQAKALSQQPRLATCPPAAMPQPQLATRLTKTTSQVHLSAEQTKVLSQGPLSIHLAKSLPPPPLSAHLMTTSPVHLPPRQTKALSQAHLAPGAVKTPAQVYPPTKLTKTPSLAHLVTCLTKTQSQVHLTTGALKVQSQAQLPIGLTKTQSQAQLITETSKSFYAAHQPADLNSKTQSQPLLTGAKVSAPSCHLGVFSSLTRAKPDDRPSQLQPQGHVQSKTIQGPCPVASEAQGMLVPLLTSAGHPTCNIESWGDSGTTRAQPPMASQAGPCQEAVAASQIASLCAELAAVLGSQEDIRALLAKALSQGEVRAALNQALSKEVLGTSMTKALPQGMLGMALVKALSWGELGITLSRALSRGELRSELSKVMQGKLARQVLSKALTDEERAALSQALCQGELGAVLSQSLSQAALRPGAVLPKSSSKAAGSGMTLLPAPVEVDCRGNLSAAWGSTVGPVRLQSSKVRVPQVAWEDFTMGQCAGLLEEMGDGATLEGSLCWSLFHVGVSLTRRTNPSIYQYPLVVGLDLIQPWERRPRRVSNLSPSVRKGSMCLSPGPGPRAWDAGTAVGAEGPPRPTPSPFQLPAHLWRSFIANGIGPSTSQPSVTCDNPPSSHKPHVVSRVASRSWTSSGEGSGALGRLPGSMGGRRAVQSQPAFPVCRDAACWCQFSGISKVSPKHSHRSMTRGPNQPSRATEENLRRRTQPPNPKQVFQGPRQMLTNMTASSLRTTVVSRVQAPKCPAGGALFHVPPAIRLGRALPRTPTPRQKGNLTRNPPHPRDHVPSHQMSLLNELVSSLPQHPDNVLVKNFSPGSGVSGPNDSGSQSSLQSCSSPSFSAMSVASLTAVELVDKAQEVISGQDPQLDSLSSQEDRGRAQRLMGAEKLERASPGLAMQNLCWRPATTPEFTPVLCRGPVSSHLTLSVHWDSEDEKDTLSPGQSSMDLVERVSQETFRLGPRRSRSLGTVVPPEQPQPALSTKLALTQPQPAVACRVGPNLANLILSQPSVGSRLTRSLSQPTVSSRAPPSRAQPSATTRSAPSPPQPRVGGRVLLVIPDTAAASEVAPGRGCVSVTGREIPSPAPPSVASEVTPRSRHPSAASRVSTSLAPRAMTNEVSVTQSALSGVSGVTPGLAQPPLASGVSPHLAQPSMAIGVSVNFAQPSMDSRVSPSLAQPCMATGLSPSLVQSSMASGVSPNVAKPLMGTETSPSLAQPSMANEVSPSFVQPSMDNRLSPSPTQSPMASGVSPNLTQRSVDSGVSPGLAKPSVATGVSPSLAYPSMASGTSSNLAQPSVTVGVSPSVPHASMASRVTPSLAQPSMVSGMSPSLGQPSVVSGMSPSLGQPSVASGMSPSLGQPSVASGMSPSLGQPSMASGMSPNLGQPSVVSGMSPSLGQPFVVSGMSPSLGQPSVASGISPSLGQPSVVSGLSPTSTQPSMTSGVSPSTPHQSVTSGVSTKFAQSSMAIGMSSSLGQSSMACGMSPSLGQASMVSGLLTHLAQPSLTSGVSSGLPHALMTSGLSPTSTQPSVASGASPRPPQPSAAPGGFLRMSQPLMPLNLADPSVAHGVSPSLGQPSMASGMAASLVQPVASGVSPRPPQQSTAHGVAPRAPQPSMANGMSPNPPHQPMASEMSQSLAQPSVASRLSPRPPYHSTAYGVAPGLAPSFMDSGVSPSFAQMCMAIGMSPNLVHPSMASGMSPSLAHPLMAGGLSPILPHPSMAGHAAPSPAHLPMASGVSPSFAQPFMASGVPPGFLHPSMAGGMPPYLAQPPVAGGVPPILAQPFIANRASPNFAQPPMPWGVSQSLAQPPVASGLSPSLAHPSVASGGYPVLSHQPMASGMAPSLIQTPPPSPAVPRLTHPFLAPGVSPLLSQSSMAELGSMSLSQPPMACSLSQSSVIYGVGRGLCEPTPGPRLDSPLQAPRVGAGAPGLCPPPVFMPLSPGRPYPCVPGRMDLGLDPPALDIETRPCDNSVVADRMIPDLQDSPLNKGSLGFHQPSSVWGRHPNLISASAPNLYQTDVTKEVTPGPNMFHPTWLKGLSACSSQGPLAAGMLLSLSQGASPAGLAGSIFQKNMAASVGPGQCQVADSLVPMASQVLETGVSLVHEETSMARGMDPSAPRPAVPNRLDTSQPTLPMYGLGPRPAQAPIPLPMLPAMATVIPSSYQYAGIVPEGSVTGIGSGGLAASSTHSQLTTATVPNAVANYVAYSLSRGSVIRGVGQSLSPGPVVTGLAQSHPLDPVASGVAHSLPTGTGVDRVAPSQIASSGTAGRSLSMGPGASFASPSLSPSLVAKGVSPTVPLGSVKSGGQNLPQGSMLIGLTPRPYHGAGEGPTALLQAPLATSLAQVRPHASGAQNTTKGQPRGPTALSRASHFSQDPGMMTFGARDDKTKSKPRALSETLTQESGSSRESSKSKILEVTPWTYQSPLENYVDPPHGTLPTEERLPKEQLPLLGERASGQARSGAPVPFPEPKLGKHSMVSSITTILQSNSGSGGAPGSYLITASGVHSRQRGSQPLTPGVSEDLLALQPEPVAHRGPPSQDTLASDVILISSHLAPGSPVTSSLHPGLVSRMESPRPLQRSGPGSVVSHVQPYQSSSKKTVSGPSQMAAVPSTFQKPVSGNPPQPSHKSLRPKKYYRFIHGKLIPELLEGSMTKVVPTNQMQRQETQSSLGSQRLSSGELWVDGTSAVHPSDAAHGPSVPRVRRVSLGYESSSSGIWRPLLEQDSHSSVRLATRHHRSSQTPSVPQGQVSRKGMGLLAGLHKPSLIPTVLQGPMDTGMAGGVPSVAVRPMDHTVAPQSLWEPARGPVSWDAVGSVDLRQQGELLVSVQTMEKIIVQAVVVIQAYARGYLVRSTIRAWHQCATVIQATWRGFHVRQNLARLYRATTIIQAAWRGYCARRDYAQQTLVPAVWVELGSKVRPTPDHCCFPGSEARLSSDHRCFQSCQPHVCSLCQSLSPGLGSPPSVVMLVGSSPRTCHMCGHTLPTRVVHGMGQSMSGHGGMLWACASQKIPQSPCKSPGQNKAAMAIQSAWRGFKTRRQLRQQQTAAKMVQSNWRGHYTRSCLTTDMLLGSGAPRDCSRDASRHSTRPSRWPGV